MALLAFLLGLAAAPPARSDELSGTEGDSVALSAERPAPLTYMGRTIAPTMSYSGASWLIRDSRDDEENPPLLLKALELKAGQAVCDFGCGNGFYTLQLAKRVGARGLVYAVDIQQEMLDMLAERLTLRGVDNVKPVLATETESGLPPATFDLVLMVDVYHELSDPAAVLAAIRASLRPKGRVAIVEFREEDPAVPILPLHKMSQAQVMREIPANGFKLVGQFDNLPWQHVLFFARDDSPVAVQQLRPWQSAE